MVNTSAEYRSRYPQVVPVPAYVGVAEKSLWQLKAEEVAQIDLMRASLILRNRLSLDHFDIRPKSNGSSRQAAVLIPIFDLRGSVGIVLTKRSRKLSRHAGEISFPGGGVEKGETFYEAAIREAKEEVGLDPSEVEGIGLLGSLQTIRHSESFLAYVARIPESAQLGESEEVEKVIRVSLRDLADPDRHHSEVWSSPEFGSRTMHFFELDTDLVWGATASLLSDLMDVLAGGEIKGGIVGNSEF